MSNLSNQLKSIKTSQNVLKIGVNQQQPSILFDKFTARNTSIDTIYSLSLLSYQKLQYNLSTSLQSIKQRQQLLHQDYKQINRNTLTKQQNNILSKKLERFIIQLSQYLLNSQTQHILQYLLRNYKINVFQIQVYVLSMLQYWNYQIYSKLISNIDKKYLTTKFTFLNQIISQKNKSINISFIIKTLTYSHSLFDKFITIVLESILGEITNNIVKNQIINMNESSKIQSSSFLKHPLKNFLLRIFLLIIKDKKKQHYKYIINFCNSCLRIKYTINNNKSYKQFYQLISLILTLIVNLLVQNAISQQYITQTIKKLIKKIQNVRNKSIGQLQLNDKLNKQLFDFVMIIWQRKRNIIDRQILLSLLKNNQYIKYFTKFSSSKYMVFYHVLQLILLQSSQQYNQQDTNNLINFVQLINVKIKQQQFYKLYQTQYLNNIFTMYNKYQQQLENNNGKVKLRLREFIKKYYKYEYAVWINSSFTKNNNKMLLECQNLKDIFDFDTQFNIKQNIINLNKIKKVIDNNNHNINNNSNNKTNNNTNNTNNNNKIQQIESQSQQQMQQQQQTYPIINKNKKLIQHLHRKGLNNINKQDQINYQNKQVLNILILLLNQYYNTNIQQQQKINNHQKNMIIQKLLSANINEQIQNIFKYDVKMLEYDLNRFQYNTIIKYLINKYQQSNGNNMSSNNNNNNSHNKKNNNKNIRKNSTNSNNSNINQTSNHVINKQQSILFIQRTFNHIICQPKVLQNIIFRQLLRLLIKYIILPLSQIYYKQTITLYSKYYKKFLISLKQSSTQLVLINGFMLKLSQKLFQHNGNNKGKYHNLLYNHCKLLSILICKLFKVNSNNNIINIQNNYNQTTHTAIITHQLIQTTYHKIIKIFTNKQLYLINIGIIQLISKKQMNYKILKYFIDQIMLKQINYQQQTQKQSQVNINFYQHILSIGKSLIFATYMYDKNLSQQWINSINPIITNAIPKNQIVIFYGLIKDKLKKNIARKILLFIKLTYQSKSFIPSFKNYLSSIHNQQQLNKILNIYSQIYFILLSLNNSQLIQNDIKIKNVIENLLNNITNLFPLQLRLILFKPLLPNTKLYQYLSTQLQSHPDIDYPQLTTLINIQPSQLSLPYITFIKQCLKRQHPISQQIITHIFTNQHFLNQQQNFQLYSQLICYIGQYQKDKLIPYINQSMNIVLAYCGKMIGQGQNKQNYCLALVYRVILAYKELVQPYVYDIYKYVLQSQSTFIQKFIIDTVENLTIPTLIDVIKKLSKKTKHYYNFGLLFKYISSKGIGHLLSKTLQYYISKTIHLSIQDQVNLSNIYELQSDIFYQMSMKFNQNQLRKVLIDFIRWSEIKQTQQINIPFNMRKIVISSIFIKLSKSLGSIFTPFYGYIFDSYLKDYQILLQNNNKDRKDINNNNINNINKSLKRDRNSNQNDFIDETILIYLQYSLKSLTQLFIHDSENDFLDGTKFDILSQKLANLYSITKLQDKQYFKMTDIYLSDCLINLCRYLKDDYQLKSLNLKILLLLRLKTSRIQQSIFTFMDKLIDQIQDRYLLFINDLVPFLIDNIHNRNQNIKIKIKSIISKVQHISGTKIENYIK